MNRETDNTVLQADLRRIAAVYDGEHAVRAYDEFEEINAEYFAGELPLPRITWGLTPHGGCLGLTRMHGAPTITLHSSLLGGREKPNPWRVNPAWLGWRFALDVLLHECIHVSVAHRLGGHSGPTSHNCPEWIAEVNRLAPLLQLNVTAARSKTKRVRDAQGHSRVVRVSDSTVPFKAIATFPRGVRIALGTAAEYYSPTAFERSADNPLRDDVPHGATAADVDYGLGVDDDCTRQR